MTKNSKLVLAAILVYLSIGLLFYLADVRIQQQGFTCTGTSCEVNRSQFDVAELGTALSMILLWLPLLLMKGFSS